MYRGPATLPNCSEPILQRCQADGGRCSTFMPRRKSLEPKCRARAALVSVSLPTEMSIDSAARAAYMLLVQFNHADRRALCAGLVGRGGVVAKAIASASAGRRS